MKDEVPFQDFPAYPEKSGNNRKKAFGIFLIALLLIAGTVAGLYFLGSNKSSDDKTVAPTHVPTPTEEPTPTASESATPTASASAKLTPTGTSSKLDRKSLNVTVLNGSGVAGAGKKIADYLAGLGYKIASTGNADTFDFKGITIKVTKKNSDYAALLKKDLSTQASGSAVTSSVDDTLTTDAAIIVGK